MLQTIREHTQGWIAGTIISVIILTFALWGIHSYFVGGAANVDVAEVNGTPITKEQLAVAYERLRRSVQSQYGTNNPTSKDEAGLKGRALQALIDVEVLKQASANQGFRISDRQIDNYLESMPDFQVDGRFSVERFQEFLSSTVLSTSEFLDLIKTNLLIGQPKLGILFTSFALPDEAAYTIALVNQERDIAYINIPMQGFMAQPIVIPADKIKAYYDQHQSDFMTPEQVNVDYIELSLKDLSAKITPTDAMLKSFYNENINSYTLPMQWKYSQMEIPVSTSATQDEVAAGRKKAIAAAGAVRNGEDFAAVAKMNSANVTTTPGWIALNQVPAELQKAVASMNKPGQVSEPFRTASGIVVVKVLDIQEPQMQAFDTVKDKVRETYVRQHAEEKFAELRDKIADLTYEHPESLQLASKTLNLPIQTSELFTKDKSGKDISQFRKVRETAFSNDVLNLQNNSDVIQLNPENVIVVRVKSHVASSLLPLNGVYKQIEDKLKAREAELMAEKFANDLRAKLQSGTDLKSIPGADKLAWAPAGFLGRYSTKVDSAILDMAFSLPNPAGAPNKIVNGVARLPNGYAIVALKSVKDGVATDKKQYSIFAEQIQNSEGLLEYELYKQSQTNNASISTQQ